RKHSGYRKEDVRSRSFCRPRPTPRKPATSHRPNCSTIPAGDYSPIRLQKETKAGAGGTPDQVANNPPVWLVAARAAEAKKARDIRVLDLREMASFADFFVLCSGSSPPQIQAISEEIGR